MLTSNNSSFSWLRTIFDASPDAITVTDLNGNIIECNQATLNLLEYSSKEELIGKSSFEFIAKKDHQRAMENMKTALEQGSVKNLEYALITKNGREFTGELSSSVVKDPSGKLTGFVAITKDITERKKMEDEIRQSLHEKDVLGAIWLDSESLAQFQPKDLEIITAVGGG